MGQNNTQIFFCYTLIASIENQQKGNKTSERNKNKKKRQ